MGVKVANSAVSTLAANITATATSLAIVASDAGKFPVLAAGDWFPMNIVDAAGNMEIVKVTARNSATLTIVRAQEGTNARAFAAGSRCDIRLTTAALLAFISDFATTLGPLAKAEVVPFENGGLGSTSKAGALSALGLKAVATSGSASDLSAGTLPNGRLTGSYSGLESLGMAGRLTNVFDSEAIRLQAKTEAGSPFMTWYNPDGTRRAYIQHRPGTGVASGFWLANDITGDRVILSNDNNVDTLRFYDASTSRYNIIYHSDNVLDIGPTATTAKAALGIANLPITKGYSGGYLAGSNAANLTWTHGLGGAPKLVRLRMRFAQEIGGYAVGDNIIAYSYDDGSRVRPGTIILTPTQVILRCSNGGYATTVAHKSTGARVNIGWEYVTIQIEAYA